MQRRSRTCSSYAAVAVVAVGGARAEAAEIVVEVAAKAGGIAAAPRHTRGEGGEAAAVVAEEAAEAEEAEAAGKVDEAGEAGGDKRMDCAHEFIACSLPLFHPAPNSCSHFSCFLMSVVATLLFTFSREARRSFAVIGLSMSSFLRFLISAALFSIGW